MFNGHEICRKYIPVDESSGVGGVSSGNRTRKKNVPYAPLFVEHADTEQLAYNLNAFKSGDWVEVTLKMHGTSQRTAHVPVFKSYKRSLADRIFRRAGKPVYEWDYVSGTRRVVMSNFEGGFYGSNEFRQQHHEFFRGKLWKGEEVYYEVVGFTHTGQPIMSSADNKKIQDKEFVKQYGKTTTFSYGCYPNGRKESSLQMQRGTIQIDDATTTVNGATATVYELAPQSDIYVYRMTMTNEDGNIVEYTPEFMRYRCEQMGVKCVPVLWRGYIPDIENDEALPEEYWITPGSFIKELAEDFYDGPDPIGKTHIREGVVVRILNRPKFTAYKHKNYSFKVLEGIIKDSAAQADMEEQEELMLNGTGQSDV